MPLPLNAQAVFCELLLDGLVSSGVRHLVLSPGSRSTPIVLAAVGRPDLVVHDVLDERSAAFVALGIARASGLPAALVCTSGSAPAHYHPAVIEADAARLPLVVLSANRPFALQHCGESQTVDQTKLFGDAVRFFADLGQPGDGADALRATRRLAAQAAYRARGPVPGPVHLDVRFVKPLEPTESGATERGHRELAASLRAEGAPRFAESTWTAGEAGLAELSSTVASSARPLVMVGAGLRRTTALATEVAALAARGFAVHVDVASGLRFGAHAERWLSSLDLLARTDAGARVRPDLVVQLGRAPVSGPLQAWCATARRCVLDDCDYTDVGSRAELVVLGDVASSLARAGDGLRPREDALRYADALREFDALARDGLADDASRGADEESDLACAALDALATGDRLLLGNSLAIRHLELHAAPRAAEIEVLVQRGASGIDGWLAGLVGAQLARPTRSMLLVGDATFAHDVGSLALLRAVRAPSVVVVIDNGGGRIFDTLPVAERAPEAMVHFRMPQALDLAAIACAFGLPSASVSTASDLRAAVERGLASDGACVVVARSSPSAGPTAAARWAKRLDARLGAR